MPEAFKKRSQFGFILLALILTPNLKEWHHAETELAESYLRPGRVVDGVAIAAPAQDSVTFALLHSFEFKDGAYPYAGLIQASDGNLYGTSLYGGNDSSDGTVFKITPGGKLTTIYRFCSESGWADGLIPYAGLVQASDGGFYGTTSSGNAWGFYGTVFRITPSGALTTLHTFDFSDGASPYGALVQGADGNFYGTTFGGGADLGGGTVFKISPSGTLTTLYNFGPSPRIARTPLPLSSWPPTGTFTGPPSTAEAAITERFSESRRMAR